MKAVTEEALERARGEAPRSIRVRWIVRVLTTTAALLFVTLIVSAIYLGGGPYRADFRTNHFELMNKGVVTVVGRPVYLYMKWLERITIIMVLLSIPAWFYRAEQWEDRQDADRGRGW